MISALLLYMFIVWWYFKIGKTFGKIPRKIQKYFGGSLVEKTVLLLATRCRGASMKKPNYHQLLSRCRTTAHSTTQHIFITKSAILHLSPITRSLLLIKYRTSLRPGPRHRHSSTARGKRWKWLVVDLLGSVSNTFGDGAGKRRARVTDQHHHSVPRVSKVLACLTTAVNRPEMRMSYSVQGFLIPD